MTSILAMLALAGTLATAPQAPASWEANFNADGTPKPLRDPSSKTVWPNKASHSNSDEWIVKNHDRIQQMRPRVLAINFANRFDPAKAMKDFNDLHAALRESSRYHGYKDPKAKPFLDPVIWRFVDLGDPNGPEGKNTTKSPIKKHIGGTDMNCDYGGFFTEKFAEYIGVRDPKNKNRFLRLDELVELGYVHELVFTAAPGGDLRALECVEEKPQYDENFKRVPGKWAQSGNGGDDDQKWTGRSLRINGLNNTRGIGCGTENLGHSFEGMAHGRAIPYFTKYFYEFAGFDLDKRYKLPFDSFYALWGPGKGVSYPDPSTAIVKDGDKTWTLKDYVCAGGNVHFMPNGRGHYDLENTEPVMSTIEDWRIGSGPDGKDIAKPWTNDVIKQYDKLAPDCMGRWLIYWRQNFPGYKNKSKDDQGKPMKNWWPFLYY